MKRYEIGIDCFDWDRHRLDVEEDADGSWIKYKDYAKEKAQAISSYTELGEVFAELEEYYSHRDNDMMRISRQQFEIIKSKYLP
ncbi:MAG: hypothetical protein GY853_01470 [PVC group bacterium]|nr:hypothetical protein [PVC group bacterium]